MIADDAGTPPEPPLTPAERLALALGTAEQAVPEPQDEERPAT